MPGSPRLFPLLLSLISETHPPATALLTPALGISPNTAIFSGPVRGGRLKHETQREVDRSLRARALQIISDGARDHPYGRCGADV